MDKRTNNIVVPAVVSLHQDPLFAIFLLSVLIYQPKTFNGTASGLLSIARDDDFFNDTLLYQFPNTTLEESSIGFCRIRKTLNNGSDLRKGLPEQNAYKCEKEII